jgi:hypothetical protein
MKKYWDIWLLALLIVLTGVSFYVAGINNIGYGGWATPRPGSVEYENNAAHRKFWHDMFR